MSMKHIFSWLVTGAVTLVLHVPAQAQHYQPFGPVDIESDYQLFSPVELDQLGGPMPANEGFFFTYDRMFTAVSRSNADVQKDFSGDVAWGNRYEFGYMSPDSVHFDGTGWLVSALRIDAPGDQAGRGNLPVPDVNQDGFVNLTDINLLPRNNASSGGVEVMKTWRAERLHYGSVIEPMIGVRWYYVHDRGLQYSESLEATGLFPDYDYSADDTWNDMVGPQVGLRWFKQNQRWLLSAEGRFMAAANFKHTYLSNVQSSTFAPLFEIRLDATYEVFHAAALRAGYTGTFVPDGISRSNLDYQLTNEDFAVHALTFGFVFNR